MSGRGGRGGFGGRGGGGGGGRGGGGGGGRGGYSAQIYTPISGSSLTPAANVASIEDSMVQKAAGAGKSELPDVSGLTLDQRLPKRPGYGTKGIKVILRTNHFDITPKPDTKVFRYNIDIKPDVNGKKRMRVVELLLSDTELNSLAPGIATDFKATLLTTKKLTAPLTTQNVRYRVEGEDAGSQGGQQYTVTLQLTGEFTISDLIEYLTSTNMNAAFDQGADLVQSLNIILGHRPKARATNAVMSVGSNRHYALSGQSSSRFDLFGALEAWRGYVLSTRTSTARILLNVQIKNAATYKVARLDSLIQEFATEYGIRPLQLDRFLNKLTVEPLHLRRNNSQGAKILKVKTVSGLATIADGASLPKPPSVEKFGALAQGVKFYLDEKPPKLKKKGATIQAPGYISVYDYFDKVHNIQVRKDVPVVNVGNRQKPMYLPSDVCEVVPGQQAKARLSPNQTQKMIRFAVRKPFENAKSIAEDSRVTLGLDGNPTLAAFGLSIGKDLLTVHGRILNSPSVFYRQQKKIEAMHGSWQMGQNTFFKPAALKNWSVLYIRPNQKQDLWGNQPMRLMDESIKPLHRVLQSCGINCQLPTPGAQVPSDTGNIVGEIEQGFTKLVERRRSDDLILVVVPFKDEMTYSAIKYYGDVVNGFNTVCVLAENLAKADPRTFANVALKFNLKLGGTNQVLESSKLGIISEGKTMVVGIDVTHPSPGSSDNAPSVAGMVASVDTLLNQFPAILRVQEARKEMVTDLSDMFKTRLNLWRKRNKDLPENIIVCRDGVSEGQYNVVVDEELPLLKDACRELYPKNREPALSIIIVGKRHNTRFYPTTTDAQATHQNSSNPRNGTVVDRGVTQARNWDFFLQSHTAIQGTARPAHYFVVHDEIFKRRRLPPGYSNAAEVLEDLVHNMCYTFGRATKAVSICPPAYYADLVCERARLYLRSLFSPDATPTGSQAPTQTTVDQQGAQGRVQINQRIEDSMFYI